MAAPSTAGFTKLAILASLIAGCATQRGPKPTETVFINPARYDGEVVMVCGQLSYSGGDHNLYQNAADRRARVSGLGVRPRNATHAALSALNGTNTCLSGELYRRGCESNVICTDSTHEFALRVDQLLPERAR